MATKVRLLAALCALVAAVVLGVAGAPGVHLAGPARVQLRSTALPMDTPTTTIKWPVIDLTDQQPFDPCTQLPIDVLRNLGLDFTPPEPQDGLRCQLDAGNYQMAIEPIIWRTYEQTLPPDALELTINGHRAAQYWVMKPTDWNDRWWHACMVTFKTSYGVIQQSMFFSQIYSDPLVDCLAENLKRAQQLSPYYIF